MQWLAYLKMKKKKCLKTLKIDTIKQTKKLMMHIRKTVYEKSGTVLVPEMIILPPDYALTDNGPEVPLNRVTGGLEAELNAAAAQETPES